MKTFTYQLGEVTVRKLLDIFGVYDMPVTDIKIHINCDCIMKVEIYSHLDTVHAEQLTELVKEVAASPIQPLEWIPQGDRRPGHSVGLDTDSWQPCTTKEGQESKPVTFREWL